MINAKDPQYSREAETDSLMKEYDDEPECWNCAGTGFTHHDCGEDTCCCLDPEDNVRCDTCEGRGYFEKGKP